MKLLTLLATNQNTGLRLICRAVILEHDAWSTQSFMHQHMFPDIPTNDYDRLTFALAIYAIRDICAD